MGRTDTKLQKKAVLDRIKDMPDRFTVDELLERVVVLQKIERGLQEMKEGKSLNTAQARKKLAKWLK
jgi:Zn-dependent alcohol dehydrogenase